MISIFIYFLAHWLDILKTFHYGLENERHKILKQDNIAYTHTLGKSSYTQKNIIQYYHCARARSKMSLLGHCRKLKNYEAEQKKIESVKVKAY